MGKKRPKSSQKMAQERVPEKHPHNGQFSTPPAETQVSSRLGESTVFTVSPGSLSDPILVSFWDHFGSQGRQDGHGKTLEVPPDAAERSFVKPPPVRVMDRGWKWTEMDGNGWKWTEPKYTQVKASPENLLTVKTYD